MTLKLSFRHVSVALLVLWIGIRVAASFMFLLSLKFSLYCVFIAVQNLRPYLWLRGLNPLHLGESLFGVITAKQGLRGLFFGQALQFHFDERIRLLLLVH